MLSRHASEAAAGDLFSTRRRCWGTMSAIAMDSTANVLQEQLLPAQRPSMQGECQRGVQARCAAHDLSPTADSVHDAMFTPVRVGEGVVVEVNPPQLQFARTATTHHAAAVVQRCYRRWRDVCVFQYLKEAIALAETSLTQPLLRKVCPSDGSLLANGYKPRLRFRFDGRRFPPVIVYKVFTCGIAVQYLSAAAAIPWGSQASADAALHMGPVHHARVERSFRRHAPQTVAPRHVASSMGGTGRHQHSPAFRKSNTKRRPQTSEGHSEPPSASVLLNRQGMPSLRAAALRCG